MFVLPWGPSLFLSIITLILSSLTLFYNEPRSAVYIFELDFTKTNFSQVITAEGVEDVNTLYTDPYVLRYGLWGYCKGVYAQNSNGAIDTSVVVETWCSETSGGHVDDVIDSFLTMIESPAGQEVNVSSTFPRNQDSDIEVAYRSALGAFVATLLSLVLLVTVINLHVFKVVSNIVISYILCIGTLLSFVQWACMAIAISSMDASISTWSKLTYVTVTRGDLWFSLALSSLIIGICVFMSMLGIVMWQGNKTEYQPVPPATATNESGKLYTSQENLDEIIEVSGERAHG